MEKSQMKKFIPLAVAALLTVSACSSDPAMNDSEVLVEEGTIVEQGEIDPVTGLPLSGYDRQGLNDNAYAGGDNNVQPGTQQDLVVNVGDRIFFGYDRSDLTSDARSTLERQAQWLSQYQNVNIVIEGHADERGTREYNLALGERRATSVRNYLVALGVSPTRVRTISYGKERPAVMGSNPAAWAQNRRGVTTVE